MVALDREEHIKSMNMTKKNDIQELAHANHELQRRLDDVMIMLAGAEERARLGISPLKESRL